jgi:hypothetical protein
MNDTSAETMQTDLKPNYWIINTDRKSGKEFSYEKRMYDLKVASVTPCDRRLWSANNCSGIAKLCDRVPAVIVGAT